MDPKTNIKKKEEKDVKKLKTRIEELENQVRRTLADYQNLEKRVAEGKRETILNSNRQLLLRLLPVLDTLMLALRHTEDKGLELSVKQFLDILSTEGVKRIETKDKKFDPKLMECVDVVEGKEGNVVAEVLAGYLLNDTILRHALVKVGKEKIDEKDEDLAKKEMQAGDYI